LKLNLNPITVSASTGGNSVPIPVDTRTLVSSVIAVSTIVSAGAALTYTVQYTYDDIYAAGYNPATGNWQVDTNFGNPTPLAVSAQSAMATKFATAIRLAVTPAGTGTVSIQAWQSDNNLGS
jgi:hypothetical protein